MSYYIGVPLVVLAALAEAAFLPYFRVFGLQPNLLLVVLVCWLMVRGQEEAFFLIPIGAVFLGLVDGAALGVAVLALAPIAVLHDLRGARLDEGQFLITVVFTLSVTLVYQTIYMLAFAAGGHSGDILSAVLRVIVPVSLLNVAILLPIYWLTWVLSPDVRRAMFA
jgi:hypothetical protein